MNHLNHARNCAHAAETDLHENYTTLDYDTLHELATLHATIAQAEALTRIAEVLETVLEAAMAETPQSVRH